jgi:hypothetical protein
LYCWWGVEKIVDRAAVRRWDRDPVQFLFAKPALDALIDLVSALAINPERYAMICKRKNGGVNRASSGTRLV